jgi:hypothetical protein
MARQSRYTINDLRADVKELNVTLKPTGYYLDVESRNGYTALDEYRVSTDPAKRDTCVRNIECGSPRKCLDAAHMYLPRETD